MTPLPLRLERDQELTFGEHLEELRWRIVIAGASVVLAAAATFAIHGRVLDWLNRPLPAGQRRLAGLGIAEPFAVTLTVCVYAGIALALPIVLWQFWSFVAPAVDPRHERRVLGLMAAAVCLGGSGAAFAYYIVLPRAVAWLTNFDSRQFVHIIQARPYYSFVAAVILGLILVFELPLAVLGLVLLGAVTADTLRANRRRGYFVVAIVAMGLPGPDIYTTMLELLPMWALFEASIWVAVVTERRRSLSAQPSGA